MEFGRESGGECESLSGLKGHRGRQVNIAESLAVTTTGVTVPDNPKRVWLAITNSHATARCVVHLNSSSIGSAAGFILLPGGSVVFNRNMPWTGIVLVSLEVAAPDSSVVITEVEVA